MDFLQLARERYSCRKFADRPVEAEKLERILAAGIAAPTATNAQPYRIWVIESPEAVEKIRACTGCHFDTKTLLLVGGKADAAWVRKFDGRNFADVDAAIVGTHIMLAASDLGLGNVWVGSFDPARIKADFPETEGYEVVCLFPVGVPAAGPAPGHAQRQPLDAFASEI